MKLPVVNPQHQRAARLFVIVLVLDLLSGLGFGFTDHVGAWNGIYFSIVTVTTVGYGDVTPHGWAPHLFAVAIMFLVLPLWGAVFSYVTAGLTAAHVEEKTAEQTKALQEHMAECADVQTRDLKDHFVEVTGYGEGS